jgi:hypothetical protein
MLVSSQTSLSIRDVGFQAVHPRERNTMLQKWGHTQIAVGTRMASYHDEVKISLPALLTPQHHLVFTFFHVDLQMKLEAPKPVCAMFLISLDYASLFSLLMSDMFFISSGDHWIFCTSTVDTYSVCIIYSIIFQCTSNIIFTLCHLPAASDVRSHSIPSHCCFSL